MQRCIVSFSAVVIVCLTTSPAPIIAQEASPQSRHARQGFWFGAGLGGGWGALECSICEGDLSDHRFGLSGYVRLGVAFSPHFLVGVEGNGWRSRESGEDLPDITTLIGTAQGVAYWYPSARIPYFFKVGVGYVGFRADDNPTDADDDDPALTSSSLGAQIGAGYDLRILNNFSITPFLNLIGTFNASATVGDTDVGDVTITLIQVGVGVTWH